MDSPPPFLSISLAAASRRRCPGIHYPGPNLYTDRGRRSSFVFIFCRLASPASRHSPPRRFVIFQGRSRSPTRFTLMKQLPSEPEPRLRWKIKRVDPERKDVPQEHAFLAIETRGFRPVLIPQPLPWQPGGQFGIGSSR